MRRMAVVAGGMALALVLAACNSDSIGSGADATDAPEAPGAVGAEGEPVDLVGAPTFADEAEDGFSQARTLTAGPELKVIRDGRIDLRIERGTFAQISAQLRSIADDLGGYVSNGQTHLEEIEEESYAVGWFTLRIPEARFEDALARAEALGERLSLNVSSQDVSEEYVDLEGRLDYWEGQEAFYLRLMDEATEITDLVVLQTRMQEVLLNIEQIEGRLRYLDGRTQYATLTVGLTEVPGAVPVPEPIEPDEPSIIMEALDQAGEVLLSTIGFMIVAAAFLLPISIIGGGAYAIWRGVTRSRKQAEPLEA